MSEWTDHVQELFSGLGTVSCRRMFGGYGLFHEGLMFALVFNEVLYLRVDERSRGWFEARGLPPFQYLRNGKPVTLAYCQAPDTVLEDPEVAVEFARQAYQVALRSRPGDDRASPYEQTDR